MGFLKEDTQSGPKGGSRNCRRRIGVFKYFSVKGGPPRWVTKMGPLRWSHKGIPKEGLPKAGHSKFPPCWVTKWGSPNSISTRRAARGVPKEDPQGGTPIGVLEEGSVGRDPQGGSENGFPSGVRRGVFPERGHQFE
jgi:hypothetical protein